MNIIKSLHAGALYRSFSFQGRHFLAVSALWAFRLDSGEPVLEKDTWSEIATQLPPDQVLDAGMPKARGEYLLAGGFHAPDETPVEAGKVTVRLGTLEKTLIVQGDRYWKRFLNGERGIAGPKPMTLMPLTWANAFGGPEYEQNPAGKGASEILVDGVPVFPLPNVEYPGELITRLGARAQPASFGPLPLAWPQRMSKAGTYDERYLKTRMPGLPDDVDWHYFNDALPDQWCPEESFWTGNETFELHYLNPDKPLLRGRLPDVRGRCFVRKREQDREIFKEVPTKLDTVWLFPSTNLGLVLHRGSLEICTADAGDVPVFLIAHENRADTPRSLAHYEDEMAKRSDPQESFKYLLNTAALIPEGCTCGFAVIQGENDFPLDMLVKKNLDRFGEQQRDKTETMLNEQQTAANEKLAAAGVDVKAALQQWEAAKQAGSPEADRIRELVDKVSPGLAEGKPIDLTRLDLKALDELHAFIAAMAAQKREKALADLQQQLETMKAEAREPAALQALQQAEQSLADLKRPPPLPRVRIDEPLRQAQAQLESLRADMQRMQPEGVDLAPLQKLEANLASAWEKQAQMQKQLKETYRTGAHLLPLSRSPHEGEELALRQKVIAALATRESLAEGDFAFVDFSGLDLSGMDLSNCYLEYADFTNANLSGANLSGAILAHAVLLNSCLEKANLRNANLGATQIRQSRFDAAQLEDAILSKARIEDTSFRRCSFSPVPGTFLDTEFVRVDFSEALLAKQAFVERDLSGSVFDGADLTESAFIKPQLNGTRFVKATLASVNFIEARGQQVDFREASMHNVRFIGGCRMEQTSFAGARITGANLREGVFLQADFENACLDGTDCSGSDLSGARLLHASAVQAQFAKTRLEHADCTRGNLWGASFMEAHLVGTCFRQANLYSANFLAATLGNTDFSGADLEQTILKDWRPA